MVLAVKDNRVEQQAWGESKKRVQIMLTPTAIDMVDSVAEELELSRTEVIERLIRSNCLKAEILRNITPPKADEAPGSPQSAPKRRKGGSAVSVVEQADIQILPDGTRVKNAAGWEGQIIGYKGNGRHLVRFDKGMKGLEDDYPAHCLTVIS